jgi:hypothetical protein
MTPVFSFTHAKSFLMTQWRTIRDFSTHYVSNAARASRVNSKIGASGFFLHAAYPAGLFGAKP